MTLIHFSLMKRLVLAIDEKIILSQKVTAENSDRVGANEGAREGFS
jgi:hypothetical protein